MKKFILLLVFPLLFACSNKEEVERMKAINDSLLATQNQRDETINDLMEAFNQIEENLGVIKEKEKIINSSTTEGQVDADAKDRINNDILAIYEIMLKNKKEISALHARLKKSNVKIKEFEKMVANLNKQLEEKDSQIGDLKQKLENLNLTVSNLEEKIDSIAKISQNTSSELEQKISALNTAHYVFGTKKELIEQKIIEKSGGLIKKGTKLTNDFNKEYFTQIDISKFKGLKLGTKSAKFITSHPSSSYKFRGTDDMVDSMIVKDPAEFWSVSKFMVIVVE